MLSRSRGGILDKSLSKGKNEINLSTFALLFAEMVKYAHNKVSTVQELQEKLAEYGRFVGVRLLDVIVLREKSYKRDTKLLSMLMFIKGTVWKNLFNKEADKLERSNDDPCRYFLIEKDPLVNTFISLPKDKSNLNCASFIAGIVEAFLTYGQLITQVQPQAKYQPVPEKISELIDNHERSEKEKNLKVDENQSLKKIELVPPNIQKYLFPNVPPEILEEISDELLAKIELPELHKLVEKNGLMAHFDEIGKEQFCPYEELLLFAMSIKEVPKMPEKWSFKVGWTKYLENGECEEVDFPDEKVLFFDIENCTIESPLAVLAVAMSPTAWYSWCSARLVENTPVPELAKLEHMIPLEPEGGSPEPRIVIGHNVGFDRARVREQYFPEKTKTRFWDTMSMNIAIYGMADHQKKVYEQSDVSMASKEEWVDAWRSRVSKNGLGAVHDRLCGDSTKLELNKSLQDAFVKENIDVIRENFQILTRYCAEDVQATFEVYQKLYPVFRERFPHPITSLGMMEMASAFLPITENWRIFYEQCNDETSDRNNKAGRNLIFASTKIQEDLGSSFKDDPWMWISEWKNHDKLKKPKWFLNLFNSQSKATLGTDEIEAKDVKFKCRDVPRIFGICYGPFPLHFKSDYGWGFLVPPEEGGFEDYSEVKTKRGEKIKMPNRAIVELVEKNREEGVGEPPLDVPVCKVGIFDFHRLPHPSKMKSNVGSPFSKDFLMDFEVGTMRATRFGENLKSYLSTLKETRFWGNYKDRFQEEITVWLDEGNKIGAIAPAIIPAGTVTRRATHKLWLTSTSPKDGMIGTSLKSMVQCTDGWKLVGADVDSQEQWLAALLGDSVVGEGKAGATAFSNMLLAGSKSDNSDLHSVVAKQVGISRNHAKVLNYARLYGAGKKHSIEFLKQQCIEENQAKNFAEKLFTTTKGEDKSYYELNSELKGDFEEFLKTACPKKYTDQHIVHGEKIFLPVYTHIDGQQSCHFENWMKEKLMGNKSKSAFPGMDQVLFLVKLYPKFPQSVSLYKHGFESHTFNFLEMIAREKSPSTPVLGCRLSQALEALPDDVPGAQDFRAKYKRTIINWVIQSTAVDFLHMLLISMKWLCEKYDIKARFVLSIHDEIRYLVKEEDKYRAALALNLSNMYVRAAISQKLGINQLPKSIAFFSQVDIDTVLRKEVDQSCKTPDGRIIPPGVALDLKDIIMKTSGSLVKGKQP
ncbi:hypothetical protein FO519_004728 [Halicephalobus sp. NKZ332]|nr:hypothetical protein FO519_004728 [Halicephalobus sp. NKZ332]